MLIANFNFLRFISAVSLLDEAWDNFNWSQGILLLNNKNYDFHMF